MKTEKNSGVVTMYLEGRIDTGNAADKEKEIMEILDGAGDNTPVFDASGLEYISSAGLRVLMKVRKKVGKPVSVVEVSSEVYDIFETTGFTELLDVSKKLREISVDGCELIGAGGFGKVYRIDDETIAKIYNEGVPRSFVERERQISQNAFKLGVPTAISFNAIKCGNQYGVIYELFNARTIAQMISADPACLQELCVKAALKLKEIHTIEVSKDSGFRSRKDIFLEWIEGFEDALTAEEISKIRDYVNAIPDRNTFLHGDYNSKNIMVQDGEILLIDIGDASYGHPIFDIAMLMLAYIILPSQPMDDERRRGLLGFDPALAKNIWGVMCGTYFGMGSQEEIEAFTKQTMPLVLIYMSYQASAVGYTTKETVVNNIMRPRLFPMLDAGLKLKVDF